MVTDVDEAITFQDFQRLRICVGTIVEAAPNPKAKVPAYVLRIDFGPLGMRTSSAQITRHYAPQDLVGLQVAAVMNFPPKLVLGAIGEDGGVTLLQPSLRVANGAPVA